MEEEAVETFTTQATPLLSYTYGEMLMNMALATALGFVIAWVYRRTHKGLSYSQSFTLTILFVTLIVAIVMMVIGGSLARAFALVGALSIIRFRTVVKDTKDTSFVFAALALGMAAGTSNYFLALSATVAISALAIVTYRFNFGALRKSEFILRFVFDQSANNRPYISYLNDNTKLLNLLHMEPSGDASSIKLTYDVVLNDDVKPDEFTGEFNQLEGLSEIVLIASKNDVDY